jgi:hypothetical protein
MKALSFGDVLLLSCGAAQLAERFSRNPTRTWRVMLLDTCVESGAVVTSATQTHAWIFGTENRGISDQGVHEALVLADLGRPALRQGSVQRR